MTEPRIYTGVIDEKNEKGCIITTKRKGTNKRSMIGYHILGKFKGNMMGLETGDWVKITYNERQKIIKIEKTVKIIKDDNYDGLSAIWIMYHEKVEMFGSLLDKIFDSKWKKERRRIITEKYMKSLLRKKSYNFSLGMAYETIMPVEYSCWEKVTNIKYPNLSMKNNVEIILCMLCKRTVSTQYNNKQYKSKFVNGL